MPARDVLQAYTEAASRRMAEAVMPYYDAVERFGADSTQAQVAAALAGRDLERAVRENHIEAAVLGGGGGLSDDAQGVLRNIIGTDTYYVQGFAADLPKLSRVQALVRANMYVNTQRNTITEITAMELPTLPIYPRDNRLDCTWHCKCNLRVVFLFGAGNADVFWELGDAEHCADCIRLAASWRPLQIRGGKIVNAKMVRVEDVERIKVALMRRAA